VSTPVLTGPVDALGEYRSEPFEIVVDGARVVHDLLRPHLPSGPPVILIHEATGLGASVLAIAGRLQGVGLTPILPVLAGAPLVTGSRVFWTICTRREFGALARGEARPTTAWLRALAEAESRNASGAPVGVIGMCFSGGYALAMALTPVVRAVVASQPAFPAALPTRRRELGVAADDLPRLRELTGDGACVRALRYQRDYMSPGVRQDELCRQLPRAETTEVPTRNPFDHPVLSDATKPNASERLQHELDASIEFLRRRLVGAPEA
jgi:dienelactone hydrolase